MKNLRMDRSAKIAKLKIAIISLDKELKRLRRENALLEKEADWLATWCADACDYRKGDCDGCAFCEQGICAKTDEKLANMPNVWREAARKEVEKEMESLVSI